ncbi:unnamed protein product [Discosporangium mesarthrocarpum]
MHATCEFRRGGNGDVIMDVWRRQVQSSSRRVGLLSGEGWGMDARDGGGYFLSFGCFPCCYFGSNATLLSPSRCRNNHHGELWKSNGGHDFSPFFTLNLPLTLTCLLTLTYTPPHPFQHHPTSLLLHHVPVTVCNHLPADFPLALSCI